MKLLRKCYNLFMNISLNIFSIIVLFGVIQGVLLSIIVFFTNKGNLKANKSFSILLLSISLSISTYIIISANIYKYAPFLIRTYEPLQFLFGPLIFLYVLFQTNTKKKINIYDVFNFIPFLIYLVYLVPFFLKGYQYQLKYAEVFLSDKADLFEIVFELLTTLHVWIYIILSILILNRYQKQIKEDYSTIDKINLNWLKAFLIGMVAVYSAFFIPAVLMIFGFNLRLIVALITTTASLSIYVMSFFVIRQSLVFNKITLNEPGTDKKDKYIKSPLKDEKINQYWKILTDLIEEERLYLNPELTLQDISEKMKLPRQYVSQIINQCYGNTFYDLINNYRVGEAKKLLKAPENKNYTILSIAFDAGFNSKATFNHIFKKMTGLTPSQFLSLK